MRHGIIILVLCTFIIAVSETVFAAGEVSETGTVGMSFLRVVPSASIAAIGSGASARFTGPSTVWSNPALITQEDSRSVQFSHVEWVQGIKQEFASFVTASHIGHFGISFRVFDSGDIELRGPTPSAEPDDYYSITNASFSLSYAREIIHGISAGVTVKKLFEKVSMETAGGYGFDVGITARTPLEGLTLACAARNYGTMGKLKNDRSKLPSDVSFGAAYRGILPMKDYPFILVGDILLPKYGDSGVRLGLELEPVERFFLRTGYRSDSDIEDVSFGIGLNFQMFSFDIAFTPMHEGFDNALRFTLGLTGF